MHLAVNWNRSLNWIVWLFIVSYFNKLNFIRLTLLRVAKTRKRGSLKSTINWNIEETRTKKKLLRCRHNWKSCFSFTLQECDAVSPKFLCYWKAFSSSFLFLFLFEVCSINLFIRWFIFQVAKFLQIISEMGKKLWSKKKREIEVEKCSFAYQVIKQFD